MMRHSNRHSEPYFNEKHGSLYAAPLCGCCRRSIQVVHERIMLTTKAEGTDKTLQFPCECREAERCVLCNRCGEHCKCRGMAS